MSCFNGLVHLNLQNDPTAKSSVRVFYNTVESYIYYKSFFVMSYNSRSVIFNSGRKYMIVLSLGVCPWVIAGRAPQVVFL